jgi:hypothetical protein
MSWVPWLLFAHILGAIAAFGPGFAFPFFGAAAGREPQHGGYLVRTSYTIATRLIVPLALLQGVTGALLVIATNIDLFKAYWLLGAIVLYGIALYIAIGLNLPNIRRLVELTSGPPPGAGGPPPGGPPPELMQRIANGRRYGTILTGLVVIIVFLMVVKPSL